MRLAAALFISGMVCSPATAQQHSYAPSLQIKSLEAADLSKLKDSGIQPDTVSAILREAQQAAPRNETSNGRLGLRMSIDALDRVITVPVVDVPPGQVSLSPELAERLKEKPWQPIWSNDNGLWGAAQSRFGDLRTQQTVPLDTLQRLMPSLPVTDQAQACWRAQSEFAGLAEGALSGKGLPSNWASRATAFEDACLNKVPAKPDPGIPMARLVVLLDEYFQPRCVGYHWKANLFLTAAHCFALGPNQVKKLAFADRVDDKNYTILQRRDDLLAVGQNTVSPRLQDDISIFEVGGLPKSKIAASAEPILASPASESPAILIGYFAMAEAGRYDYARAPWWESLRSSSVEGYCRVFLQARGSDGKGCIEHSCQAVPGFSGAPLFVKDNGQWRIVGIHVAGGADLGKRACGFQPEGGRLHYIGNVAALIPDILHHQQMGGLE